MVAKYYAQFGTGESRMLGALSIYADSLFQPRNAGVTIYAKPSTKDRSAIGPIPKQSIFRSFGFGCLLVLLLGCNGSIAFGAASVVTYLNRAADRDGTRECRAGSSANAKELVISEIFSEVIERTPGRDKGSEQLFLPIRQIAQPLARLGAACLDGELASCEKFEGWLRDIVQTDSLRLDRQKHQKSPVSLVTGELSGNITIRPLALYAEALRQHGQLSSIPVESLIEWFDRRIEEYNHYPDKLTPVAAQNLVLNSVIARLTVKLISDADPKRTYDAAQRARRIFMLYLDNARPDGSFPAETRRGVSALKYTNMTVGLLVALAEIAQTLDMDLYSYRSPRGVSIHTAVGFLLYAIQDESVIEGYAVENFAPTDPSKNGRQNRGFLADHLEWMRMYQKRFPDNANVILMESLRRAAGIKYQEHFDEILGVYTGCGR